MIYIEALEHQHQNSTNKQNGHRTKYLQLNHDYLLLDLLAQLVDVQKNLCQRLKIDTSIPRFRAHSYEYPNFRVMKRPVKGHWQPVLKSIDDAWLDFKDKQAQFIKRRNTNDVNKRIKQTPMWSEGIIEMLNSVTQLIADEWSETDPSEAKHLTNGWMIAINIMTNLIPERADKAPRRINIPGPNQVAYDDIQAPDQYDQWVRNIRQIPYFTHIY